ncbi:MAG: hypothetical protein KDC67_13450 [Ignavibacteriae bacterium]|nr:hypothetical protein [Ignavibacteriota bacterium]MCB0749493.1 hypothetical protein [Ignavibacteriota bacterium]
MTKLKKCHSHESGNREKPNGFSIKAFGNDRRGEMSLWFAFCAIPESVNNVKI